MTQMPSSLSKQRRVIHCCDRIRCGLMVLAVGIAFPTLSLATTKKTPKQRSSTPTKDRNTRRKHDNDPGTLQVARKGSNTGEATKLVRKVSRSRSSEVNAVKKIVRLSNLQQKIDAMKDAGFVVDDSVDNRARVTFRADSQNTTEYDSIVVQIDKAASLALIRVTGKDPINQKEWSIDFPIDDSNRHFSFDHIVQWVTEVNGSTIVETYQNRDGSFKWTDTRIDSPDGQSRLHTANGRELKLPNSADKLEFSSGDVDIRMDLPDGKSGELVEFALTKNLTTHDTFLGTFVRDAMDDKISYTFNDSIETMRPDYSENAADDLLFIKQIVEMGVRESLWVAMYSKAPVDIQIKYKEKTLSVGNIMFGDSSVAKTTNISALSVANTSNNRLLKAMFDVILTELGFTQSLGEEARLH